MSHIHLDIQPYLPAYHFGELRLRNYCATITDTTKQPTSIPPAVHSRGLITNFSSKSRRRLLLRLSKIDFACYKAKLFFTVTFGKEYPQDPQAIKRLLLSLVKRIDRLTKNTPLIWRMEFQQRGAPHFHFIILLHHQMQYYIKLGLPGKLKRAWGDLTRKINPYSYTMGSDVRQINNNTAVFHYLAKYAGKPSDYSLNISFGRVWGVRNNPCTMSVHDFKPSLIFINEFRERYVNLLAHIPDLSPQVQRYFLESPFCQILLTPKQLYLMLQGLINDTGEDPPNTVLPDYPLSAWIRDAIKYGNLGDPNF